MTRRDVLHRVLDGVDAAVAAGQGQLRRSVAVTMGTPGADFELAVGFLYS